MEESKRLVHSFFEEYFIRKNMAVADKVLADNYVLHDPYVPSASVGKEGFKKLQSTYFDAFPDHRLTVDEEFGEGDKVVTRWTTRGTHKKDLPGIPATGKAITVTGITISRVSDGKIAEEWQVWDKLGLLEQLGVIKAPKA